MTYAKDTARPVDRACPVCRLTFLDGWQFLAHVRGHDTRRWSHTWKPTTWDMQNARAWGLE